MSEKRDNWVDQEEDDDLETLKRRRRGRDEGDEPRSRKRRNTPQMQSFSIMADFGKFYATLTYAAPEGYSEEDVEDFIYDLKDNGVKVYRPKSRDKGDRNNRYNNKRGRGYDRYDD